MGDQLTDVPADSTDVPRIAPLTYEDADERTRQVWDEMRPSPDDPRPGPNVEHPVFRTFMHHPELAQVHSPFVQYLKYSTCLPERHRELAILRSAWNCGADALWVAHSEIGLGSGLTQDEIDRVPVGPGAPEWSPEEAAVLRAVDELDGTSRVGGDTWKALTRQYDSRQIIELLLLVGNYRTLAYFQNSIGVRPETDAPNIPGNRFQFAAS